MCSPARGNSCLRWYLVSSKEFLMSRISTSTALVWPSRWALLLACTSKSRIQTVWVIVLDYEESASYLDSTQAPSEWFCRTDRNQRKNMLLQIWMNARTLLHPWDGDPYLRAWSTVRGLGKRLHRKYWIFLQLLLVPCQSIGHRQKSCGGYPANRMIQTTRQIEDRPSLSKRW